MRIRHIGIIAIALLLASGVAMAQTKSSKATAQAGAISILTDSESGGVDGYTTILSGGIHTSQQKDLFLGVSLECGLYTRTLSKSKGGNKDTSFAEAAVRVKVLIDGCLSVVDGIVILDEECLLPEEIELVLDTMNANTFNFLHPDAGVGSHVIEVQAMIDLGTDYEAGDVEARATLGKGSLTVEEVRLIKSEEIEL